MDASRLPMERNTMSKVVRHFDAPLLRLENDIKEMRGQEDYRDLVVYIEGVKRRLNSVTSRLIKEIVAFDIYPGQMEDSVKKMEEMERLILKKESFKEAL